MSKSPTSTCIHEVGLAFEDDKLIRFHHCDPAGIIFYPQYFVLFNELVEDWFTKGLEVSFVEQITKDRVSIPMGRVECDFIAPSKIGDILRFCLRVARIGKSSIKLAIEVRHHEEIRVRANLTVVLASLETLRSVAISDDLRARMSRYLIP
ncbi:MAG TPA: thioesterase family protein [Hyphomicrobiaceae bacterium]|nr:thioesterase family protein [Hyphomicrobiaceae bacterium]